MNTQLDLFTPRAMSVPIDQPVIAQAEEPRKLCPIVTGCVGATGDLATLVVDSIRGIARLVALVAMLGTITSSISVAATERQFRDWLDRYPAGTRMA